MNPDPATPTSLEEGLSTLHHEIPWPAHPFFAPPRRPDTEPWLIISGPSRMGNHLLLSLLDGHPQLPDSPGEDGFLSFGFQAALKDPDGFLDGLRRSGGVFLRQFAANEKFDKWRTYADHARAGRIGASPSGVGTSEIPAVFDYRGPGASIDFEAFEKTLSEKLSERRPDSMAVVLRLYVRALATLMPTNPHKRNKRYDAVICHSGMRVQALWALNAFPSARLAAILRPFETYAPSHHRSRRRGRALDDQGLEEAWSHWRSKIADYATIKRVFPDRVRLLSYHDLVEATEPAMRALALALGLDWDACLTRATLGGRPTGGNASDGRAEACGPRGLYGKGDILAERFMPTEAASIWQGLVPLFDYVRAERGA